MNILISSAAAKRPLIEGFRAALTALGSSGKLIAADSREMVPAVHYTDVFVQQPLDSADDYAEQWLDICRACHVDLLVPTRDAELMALSQIKSLLAEESVTVLAPDANAISTCLDKQRFYDFCTVNGFPVLPRISRPTPADLPLFTRARHSAGSRSAVAITSPAELKTLSEEFLVQPYCDLPEFSIDTLFSLAGEPLQAVVRERLEVVNGESVVTVIRDIPALSELALALGKALGLRGHAVVQCFYDEQQGPLLIECNPRFGGASMVSVAAGLASCERILLELIGEKARAYQPRPIHGGETIDRRDLPPGVVL